MLDHFDFCHKTQKEFKELSDTAIIKLLPFLSAYIKMF